MKNINKKLIFGLLALVMVITAVIGPLNQVLAMPGIIFGSGDEARPQKKVEIENTQVVEEQEANKQVTGVKEVARKPKYLFLFIGDGMAHVQVHAAQVYLGNNTYGEVEPKIIDFAKFPITGVMTTQDSTSFCPDSASTATSMAGGVKTHSGTIGLTVDKSQEVETVAEKAKKAGMKVGIISSVTLNHATPAAFYANVESRNSYYEIGNQMADSGFDYFAGGSLGQRFGKENDQKDLYEVLREKGYTVTETKADFQALKAGDKAYAVSERLQDSNAMPYTLDQTADDVTLADYVKKGIEVLDNEKGFFMMCESGKIDWACHANDAAATIHEVIGFNDAIKEAIKFYQKHPDETLILVTGDHETGGLTIGHATTGYDTAFDMIEKQKMTYVDFDKKFDEMKKANFNLKLEDVLPEIEKQFGLKVDAKVNEGDKPEDPFVLSAYEYKLLQDAFAESMKEKADRTKTQETGLLYGGYNPISVTLTHILNNKAGIGWTSYSHTGVPIAVYAQGATSESYGGYYDNTDLFTMMCDSLGLKY